MIRSNRLTSKINWNLHSQIALSASVIVLGLGIPLTAVAQPSYVQEFDAREFDPVSMTEFAALPDGWTTQFDPGSDPDCGRPVIGDNLSAQRVKPLGWKDDHLGGDYLRAPYPIGISAGVHNQWWGSRDDRPRLVDPWGAMTTRCVGSIRSPDPHDPGYDRTNAIVIGPNSRQRYVSFLIGGGVAGGSVSITWIEGCPRGTVGGPECPPFPVPQTLQVYEYDSIADIPESGPPTGRRTNALAVPEGQQMRQVIWDTWAHDCSGFGVGPFVCRRPETVATVTINAADSGIHVDRIMVSSRADLLPPPYGAVGPDVTIPAPLWGYADLHAHWLSHISNGARPFHVNNAAGNWTTSEALRTVLPALWGSPWASGDTESARLQNAIPICDRQGHSGTDSSGTHRVRTHGAAGLVLATMNAKDGSETSNNRHGNNGHTGTAYQLTPFPFFTLTLQQMFYTWVRRAWQGGLRLMVTDVVWSPTIEVLLSNWVTTPRNFVATDSDYNSGTGPLISRSTGHKTAYGYTRDGRSHVQSQVCATLKLANLEDVSEFAQVAFTPQQARDIIADGKLAIVIGSELDTHGGLRGFADVAEEIRWMRDLGVRKFSPVHLVDNSLGGAAVSTDLFNIYNDAMDLTHNMVGGHCLRSDDPAGHLSATDQWRRRHFKWFAYEPDDLDSAGFVDGTPTGVPTGTARCQLTWDRLNHGHYDGDDLHQDHDGDGLINVFDPFWTGDTDFDGVVDRWDLMKHTPTNYFDIEEGCPQYDPDDSGFNPHDSECISFRFFPDLSNAPQRAVLVETLLHSTQDHLHVELEKDFDLTNHPRYANYSRDDTDANWLYGHRNARGLQVAGVSYVTELMKHGVIVDVTHAGEKTVADIIGSTSGTSGLIWNAASGCTGADDVSFLTPECQRSAYPVVATHGTFRTIRPSRDEAPDIPELWASERDVSQSQYMRIVASGGMVGLGTGFTAVGGVPSSGVRSNCVGSSKNFTQGYSYGVDVMETIRDTGVPLMEQRGMLPDYWGLRGIALGTDMNGYAAQTGPRFGFAGCQRYDSDDDQRNQQWSEQNAVRYDIVPRPGSSERYWLSDPDSELPLMRIRTDAGPLPIELVGNILWKASYHGFDFNELGLVNYGLIPDFLQDVVNGAVRSDTSQDNRNALRERMRFLYRSAEDFIASWERSIVNCQRYLDPGDPSDDRQCDPPATSTLDPGTCNAWVNMTSITGPGTGTATAALTATDNDSTQSCTGKCDLGCAKDPVKPCCSDFATACAPSCTGHCGDVAENDAMRCSCEDECTRSGDCCPDAVTVCEIEP